MNFRTITKLVLFFIITLFLVGISFFAFMRLNQANERTNSNLYEWVPDDCVGVFESDNVEFFLNELSHTTYVEKLDTFLTTDFVKVVLQDLVGFTSEDSHSLNNYMNHFVLSFHSSVDPLQTVAYFRVGEEARKYLQAYIKKRFGVNFTPQSETYRGIRIAVYPLGEDAYMSVCSGKGMVAVSPQKKLIERVIDAHKDDTSLSNDELFASMYQKKTANFVSLYGRTSAVKGLSDEKEECWSSFDVNFNSEMFYLSGYTAMPDSNKVHALQKLSEISPLNEKGALVVVGQENVDSCISSRIASESTDIFDVCVSSLSRDASCIMVLDMDNCVADPARYEQYLPTFISQFPWLFHSFIVSMQLTVFEDTVYHLFTFTYKG